jgi:hypothetical protein
MKAGIVRRPLRSLPFLDDGATTEIPKSEFPDFALTAYKGVSALGEQVVPRLSNVWIERYCVGEGAVTIFNAHPLLANSESLKVI